MQRLFLALALASVAGCAPKAEDPQAAAWLAVLPQPTAEGIGRVRALPAPFSAGDPAAGRRVFVLCADCHGLQADSPEGKGPHLAGVIGAPAASRSTYDYSPALRTSGVVWDVRRLDPWIFNPHEMMPATRMSFIGVRNDRKRRDLIAYLVAVTEPQSAAKQ